MNKRTKPRFRYRPHNFNSFIPKACETNVSYAQFSPINIEKQSIFTDTVAKPRLATCSAPAVRATYTMFNYHTNNVTTIPEVAGPANPR